MFHTYKLSEKTHPYAGVDVSWDEKGKALRWELWTIMAMVILSSPFVTTRMFAWEMKVIIVDQKDEANHFYWDSVVQNCPGTNGFDPYIPRLYRRDSKYQVITAVCNTFVDNLRSVESTQKVVRYEIHSVETIMG